MRYDGDNVKDEFEEAFGMKLEDMNPRMAWWLVKVIKHCRQRCRNNAALNNWLNRNFQHLLFKEVTKQRQDGSTYPGLSINSSVDNTTVVGEDE